jgi:uncharacterized protein (UPF0305 family)
MARKIYFGDLRIVIVEHINEIKQQDIEAYSTEWFLLKYLQRLSVSTNELSRSHEVEGSMRALMRFYVDNIEERSDLARRCKHIHSKYRETLLTLQRARYRND